MSTFQRFTGRGSQSSDSPAEDSSSDDSASLTSDDELLDDANETDTLNIEKAKQEIFKNLITSDISSSIALRELKKIHYDRTPQGSVSGQQEYSVANVERSMTSATYHLPLPSEKDFENFQQLNDHVIMFAAQHGYNFVKYSAGYHHRTKDLRQVVLLCHMHNKPCDGCTSEYRTSKGMDTQCPFRIIVKQCGKMGRWTFDVFGEHNHPTTHSFDVLASAERLLEEVEEAIIKHHKGGVMPQVILHRVREDIPSSVSQRIH